MFIEIKYWFATFILWLFGWKEEGDYQRQRKKIIKLNKYMILGEPHTHRLDFFLMLFIFWYYKLENLRFFINKKHMYPFVSIILDFLGAVVVENKGGLVNEIVKEIDRREKIVVQMAPSGTRSKTNKWKSGFYHIAYNSKIPVVCSYIDSDKKIFGFGGPFELTGNYKQDMDEIRKVYLNKNGLNKYNNSVIYIKEEESIKK